MADPIYNLAYDSRKPKDIQADPQGKPIWKNCGVIFENDNPDSKVKMNVIMDGHVPIKAFPYEKKPPKDYSNNQDQNQQGYNQNQGYGGNRGYNNR
tara:strand:- start:599 stop:886 length:288 start_codon:yes stop_codon:yes gene_type:complete